VKVGGGSDNKGTTMGTDENFEDLPIVKDTQNSACVFLIQLFHCSSTDREGLRGQDRGAEK